MEICAENKTKIKLHASVCLFCSYECRATSNAMILLSALDMKIFRMAHHANLKHVLGWHMFQNST